MSYGLIRRIAVKVNSVPDFGFRIADFGSFDKLPDAWIGTDRTSFGSFDKLPDAWIGTDRTSFGLRILEAP